MAVHIHTLLKALKLLYEYYQTSSNTADDNKSNNNIHRDDLGSENSGLSNMAAVYGL